MAGAWGQRPLVIPAVTVAVALAASGFFVSETASGGIVTLLVSAAALGAALTLLLTGQRRGAVLVSVLIAAFIGGALFNASFLAKDSVGRDLILFLLAVTFATDTGAYAVGRTLGSHKLAPTVSPGKTWEGAIGGFASALVAGAVFTLVIGAGIQLLVVAAIMGVTGQAGDLYVSKLKRAAGLSDSGSIFPGHGGMLDRMDSLSFNLIVLGMTMFVLI